ncbi:MULTISPECIES: hypothetical protein [unclassified Burkholderia]|uniref:hypothetical protein n=1 Tax=unclassified Burkholderia TaxID=2613784 RepID=UPI000A9AFD29|nr:MULTISPECIES: hypothetical protein [unclassified Burkholderia]
MILCGASGAPPMSSRRRAPGGNRVVRAAGRRCSRGGSVECAARMRAANGGHIQFFWIFNWIVDGIFCEYSIDSRGSDC